jgi:hypothetical protein
MTVFRYKSLFLVPLQSKTRPLCLGEQEHFSFLVVNDANVDVPGATVFANGKAYSTGTDGMAIVPLPTDEEGIQDLKAWAEKDGYSNSLPFETSFEVVACDWNLRMDYNEEYIDVKDIWVIQGSVEIFDTPFTANEDGTLVMTPGTESLAYLTGNPPIQAEYHGNVYTPFQAMKCITTPPLQGTYTIDFSGNYESGLLFINLSAQPAKLPSTVTITCVPADPNITVAPFAYPAMQNLDLIPKADLTEFACPSQGCIKRFKLDQLVIWPFDDSIYSSGVLIVERLKK